MAERKKISKKLRFEVFKRDKFTCQYCGRMAPDVVLEVDHIKPVSKGGTNDIMNLVTSCYECNRGKTNIELSDDTIVKKQQMQLQEIAEKREQLEMMLQWRESLKNLDDEYINAIDDIFSSCTDFTMSETGKKKVKKWLKEFSLGEIMDAAEIALDQYYTGTSVSWDIAFDKIPRICNIKRQVKNDSDKESWLYYANYTIKALKNNGLYCDPRRVKIYVKNNVTNAVLFDILKDAIKNARNWSEFVSMCRETIGGDL